MKSLPKDQPSDIDPHVELQSHLKYAGLNLNELTSQQENVCTCARWWYEHEGVCPRGWVLRTFCI